jgi:hypothetical protein
LSTLAQLGVRYVVQQGLEQEQADRLGRGRYERGAGTRGLRNGYEVPLFTPPRAASASGCRRCVMPRPLPLQADRVPGQQHRGA